MENIPGYTIKRKLGAGGMAEVFLATQESFGRDVAIKVLSPSVASNQEFAARFLREAKIVAGLSHPHIIPVYQVGKSGNNYYMSMDYLPGGDLSQWIKSGIPEDEILRIVQQIADALQYAHHKGYMHRDIKPANIMFREDNSAVLTDFGIARMQNASDQLTQAGTIIGTPKYMSPEAIKGREPDGRADIYALGIVFYEMLMKTVPYMAADFTALAVKHVQEPIPELPKAYSKYQKFLNKILAKDASDRYQTGREIGRAIKEIQNLVNVSTASEQATPRVQQAANHAKPSAGGDKLAEIEDGVSFEETTQRRGLFKKYALICHIKEQDAHAMSVIFNNASTKIAEWYAKHKGKIDSIEINFITESWCFDRADKLVEDMYKAGGIYSFLKKILLKVSFVSLDGKDSQSYKFNEKGEKVVSV